MSWIGKLIGALLGLWLFRHPLGALLGLFIGHAFDAGVFSMRPARVPPRGFLAPLFGLIGALAKSDGRISEAEIAATETLMQRMGLDELQRRAAIAQFTAGKQPDFAAHLAIADLKAWCAGRRDHAYILIDLLLDVVFAEGPPTPSKITLLRKLTWALGVNDRELAALAAMRGHDWHMGGAHRHRHAGEPPPRRPAESGPDPYAVLGVSHEAGEKEIKRAYRKLIGEHHPDRLGDVSPELRQRAEERAREINAAYERIKSARGFK